MAKILYSCLQDIPSRINGIKVNDIDSTIQMLEYFKSPSAAHLGDLNANNPLIQTINKASTNLQNLNAQGITAFSAKIIIRF